MANLVVELSLGWRGCGFLLLRLQFEGDELDALL
jgi:hypothetical protein